MVNLGWIGVRSSHHKSPADENPVSDTRSIGTNSLSALRFPKQYKPILKEKTATPANRADIQNAPAAWNGIRAKPMAEPDSSAQKAGKPMICESQEGECPNEDDDFLANTREFTPKEDVLELKREILSQRDHLKAAEKERAEDEIARRKGFQDLHTRNEEIAKKNLRRQPKAPKLGSHTRRFLYDGTVDRLRESTVHIAIYRAHDNFLIGDYRRSEQHAEQALKHAKVLTYDPLSAWCHYHIGKAKCQQKRYDHALTSFEKAAKARGYYISEEDIDVWVTMARAGEELLARGGSDSPEASESGRGMSNLADELDGWGSPNSPAVSVAEAFGRVAAC